MTNIRQAIAVPQALYTLQPALHVRTPNGQQRCAGRYSPVEGERPNGLPLWKHDAEDYWVYSGKNMMWAIGNKDAKAKDFQDIAKGDNVIYCPTPHGSRCRPHELSGWKRIDDAGDWHDDGDIVLELAVEDDDEELRRVTATPLRDQENADPDGGGGAPPGVGGGAQGSGASVAAVAVTLGRSRKGEPVDVMRLLRGAGALNYIPS